jgi:hypothetical protein
MTVQLLTQQTELKQRLIDDCLEQRKHNGGHLVEKKNDKSSSSFSSSSSNKSKQQIEKLKPETDHNDPNRKPAAYIYRILLSLIKLYFATLNFVSIAYMQAFYFFIIKYEQLSTLLKSFFGLRSELCSERLTDKLVAPIHVCIIINESFNNKKSKLEDHFGLAENYESERLFKMMKLIADFFSSMDVQMLTFYKFEGKIDLIEV